jgi:hypothetical protein
MSNFLPRSSARPKSCNTSILTTPRKNFGSWRFRANSFSRARAPIFPNNHSDILIFYKSLDWSKRYHNTICKQCNSVYLVESTIAWLSRKPRVRMVFYMLYPGLCSTYIFTPASNKNAYKNKYLYTSKVSRTRIDGTGFQPGGEIGVSLLPPHSLMNKYHGGTDDYIQTNDFSCKNRIVTIV